MARRYGVALFDVARKAGTLDRAEGQLAAFVAFVGAEPELRRVFDSPAVAPSKKRAILDAVLAKAPDIDGEVRQLLRMLADRDRLVILPDIRRRLPGGCARSATCCRPKSRRPCRCPRPSARRSTPRSAAPPDRT